MWRGAILPVATCEGGSEWALPVQGVWRICGVALTAGCIGVSSIKLARVLWGLRAAEVRSTSQKEGRRPQLGGICETAPFVGLLCANYESYFKAFANVSGRHTFSNASASLNRGAISLSRNPAMPQPIRVT